MPKQILTTPESAYRLLWWPLVLFVLHFLITGYLNRFATDDFEFLNKLRDYGFTGSVAFFYHTWSVRWSSIGLMNVFLSLKEIVPPLMVYAFFVLVLFLIAGIRLVRPVFQAGNKNSVLLSGYFLMGLFYACFDIGETFYWINSSVTYLVATAFLMLLIGELTDPGYRWYSWPVVIAAAAYIGGSYEPMSFVLMCFSIAFLYLIFRTKGPMAAGRSAVLKAIIMLSVLMIAFAVSFAGEGHKIRSTFLPDTTILYRLWAFTKAMIKILILFGPWKLVVSLLFCFPFYLLSARGDIRLPFRATLLQATGVLFLLLALSYFPIVFVMSEMGPERAWMQVTLYLNLYAVFIAVKLGAKYPNFMNTNHTGKYTAGLLVVLTIFAGFNIYHDVIYAKAYDVRMDELQSLSVSNEKLSDIIILESLPEPGLLKSAEISGNQDDAFNHFLKEHFRLKSKLRKGPETDPSAF